MTTITVLLIGCSDFYSVILGTCNYFVNEKPVLKYTLQ